MKIHEYQAKGLLAKYGVPVPRGEVAFAPEEQQMRLIKARLLPPVIGCFVIARHNALFVLETRRP